MVVQMVILNIYHKVPLIPVPDWLKAVTRCLSCVCGNVRVRNVSADDQENEETTRECKSKRGATEEKNLETNNNSILEELCKITSRMDSHVVGEGLREEWQIVGHTLDRFCFIIFITVQMGLVIATYWMIP